MVPINCYCCCFGLVGWFGMDFVFSLSLRYIFIPFASDKRYFVRRIADGIDRIIRQW